MAGRTVEGMVTEEVVGMKMARPAEEGMATEEMVGRRWKGKLRRVWCCEDGWEEDGSVTCGR